MVDFNSCLVWLELLVVENKVFEGGEEKVDYLLGIRGDAFSLSSCSYLKGLSPVPCLR